MTHHRVLTLIAVAVVSISASGCRTRSTPAPVTREPAGTQQPGQTADRGDFDEGPSDVRMDPRLAELCQIPTPNFAFDSAKVDPQAKDALEALAECVTTGRAKDEELRLVGHADPRGDEEYNFALGQRRASSVADYLKNQGVPADRIETSSRGELEATGTDPSSYAEDRRVDIMLAG